MVRTRLQGCIVERGGRESWELCFRGVDGWKSNINEESMSNNEMSIVVTPKPIHLSPISCVKHIPLQILLRVLNLQPPRAYTPVNTPNQRQIIK